MRALLLLLMLYGVPAGAAELRVVSSGGFAEAYRALLPGFEAATGASVTTEWGPSMGATPQAASRVLNLLSSPRIAASPAGLVETYPSRRVRRRSSALA